MTSYKAKFGALLLCCIFSLLCLYIVNMITPLKFPLFYNAYILKDVCQEHCRQNDIVCIELNKMLIEVSTISNNFTDKLFHLLQNLSCFDRNDNSFDPSAKTLFEKPNPENKTVLPKQNTEKPPELLDVCPEIYKGMRYGYPHYLTGFVHKNCTNVKALSNVVTIVLNSFDNLFNLSNVIKAIEFEYPDVTVIISTAENKTIYTNSSHIKIIYHKQNMSLGAVWNDLLKRVNTPYVFIGENIEDLTNHTRFRRQIGMLSDFDDVGAVGGAIRDSEGTWVYNCFQQNMYNYILKIEEGYYKSKNECMICDHLEGPFMAKTAILLQAMFDFKLKSNIFIDLFIRLRKQNILILSCIDVMNYVYHLLDETKMNWLPIAKKWGLNRIVLPTGVIHSFDCDETNMQCDPFETTKQYLMPICCMDLMANALIKVTQLCEQLNITFMIDNGSLLGATKLYYPMPWDLDADVDFRDVDFERFKSSVSTLKYGITWDKLQTYNNITSASGNLYIKPSLYIELWPWDFASGYIVPHKKQTKIKIGNYYVYVPNNPGLFVRNRYGSNILKHSVSWITLKKKDSWRPYNEAGSFPDCKVVDSHACLNKFSADGNIQFKIP